MKLPGHEERSGRLRVTACHSSTSQLDVLVLDPPTREAIHNAWVAVGVFGSGCNAPPPTPKLNVEDLFCNSALGLSSVGVPGRDDVSRRVRAAGRLVVARLGTVKPPVPRHTDSSQRRSLPFRDFHCAGLVCRLA
jgi:hypothetical protein